MALVHFIDKPEATTEELMKLIPGPDFPTGGIIYARDLAQVYGTGHGRVVQRARVIFEESKAGREQIIVTELPYQVNPSRVLQTIAELVNERKLEGIADLRNETGRREGTRLVIELKRDARPYTVLNNLYKHTQLQSTFSCILLALVDGRPQVLSLPQHPAPLPGVPPQCGGAANPPRSWSALASGPTSSKVCASACRTLMR